MGKFITTSVKGLGELQMQFEKVEKIPKKVITKAAKEGVKDPLAQAKANAPRKSGALKKGIKKFMEKGGNRRKKTVYRVVFDRKFNDIFQKKIKPEGRGTRGASPPRETGYYPVSQEYGFKVGIGRPKKQGLGFVAKAINQNAESSYQKIVKVLEDEIKKLI